MTFFLRDDPAGELVVSIYPSCILYLQILFHLTGKGAPSLLQTKYS